MMTLVYILLGAMLATGVLFILCRFALRDWINNYFR